MENSLKELKNMIYASLFTALIIIGSYISIPTGIVPVVMANFMIFILSLVLEKKWALLSVLIYVLLGALGLPVFSGAVGGLHHLYGPTGGYLFGYIIAAYIISHLSGKKKAFTKDLFALLTGALVIHILGIFWLAVRFPDAWQKTLVIYWIFVLGDLAKIFFALFCVKHIRFALKLNTND